jgi:hypothetical protein
MNHLSPRMTPLHSRSLKNLLTVFPTMLIFCFITSFAQEYTRGVGIYPGNVNEVFSPTMKIDSTNYRNLALHRPVYQSGSYDFNLTGQLLTDGIKDSLLPAWIVTTTSTGGMLKRNEREAVLDRHIMTRNNLLGAKAWLQIELAGKSIIPDVDSIAIAGNVLIDSLQVRPWQITITGSNDTIRWDTIGTLNGSWLPGDSVTGPWRRFLPPNLRMFTFPLKLQKISHFSIYRIIVNSPNVLTWGVTEFALCSKGRHADVGGPYHFSSAWMSSGSSEEWAYVDLGSSCSFDRIVLSWIRHTTDCIIQISNDAKAWKDITAVPSSSLLVDDIKLEKSANARYVRLLLKQVPSAKGFVLSELEIFGKGGPVAIAHSQPPAKKDGNIVLSGGAWKLQRASLVQSDGETLSKSGFNDNSWIIATVPGTVLASYLNAGALPDPNFGDNQLMISDSYFYSDFWYRDEFVVPQSFKGRSIFLNFDGINWKAEVYLNGTTLGHIDGAFTRGMFDVTKILLPGETNVLAVLIKKNDHPGFVKEQTKLSHDANGGEIGADNPTFHASVGWDWIPSIRGRNTGIWNKVFLSTTGPVTINDPFVSAKLPLPDTTSADVSIELTLRNHQYSPVKGVLQGTFGTISFKQPVSLDSLESRTIKLNPTTHHSLHIQHPKLWWPNGYGGQNLYNVKLAFVTADNKLSDTKSFSTGIREMSYSEKDTVLRIWVNGKRFIGKGGNWGFSESMLRYRAREYDVAVRYHKEMNFTMIRNWVGQVPDDEFFEACDRYGIMVWQDFWLANPLDGPNPNNHSLFMNNANDFIKRIRNHPSLGLYCGRNEGNPPAALDSSLRVAITQLHPDIHYISNSAFGVVSGGGPYRAMPVKFYFDKRATERLHSELGMPNMVSYESLRLMLPDSALWPIERLWGVHDFNLESAQYGKSFIQQINDRFGTIDSLREWLTLAQWINYDGYRAMFEAQSRNRMGLLLWMSHPAWPSMVWQTYDYYFEPTAAYFGCKKACEPLHIQWNALTDSIEVVNYSSPVGHGFTATIEVFNLNGEVQWQKHIAVDCPIDRIVRCWKMEFPDTAQQISFVRLRLMKGTTFISENSYWHGIKENNLSALRSLPKVKLEMRTNTVRKGSTWHLTVMLANTTKAPTPMMKLSVVGKKDHERILPVIFSDNYVSLMPEEKRRIEIEVQDADTRGEKPDVVLEGMNLR